MENNTQAGSSIADSITQSATASGSRRRTSGLMAQEESLIKNDFEQDISEIESYLTQMGETIRETRSPMSSSDQAPEASLMPQYRPGTVGVGDFSDTEILALTLQAEAGGEGYKGMLAAGSVIANRVASGKYGKGISGVIMKPGQFSAWNGVTGYAGGEGAINMDKVRPSKDALKAAQDIISGNYEDITGGATHYYNPKVASPKWGGEVGDNWFDIGNHRFGKADQ